MNKNEKGFSLVVVVIFMSIAALFIGYLMGSYLISFLVEEDSTDMADQEQNSAAVSQQLPERSEEKAEETNNNKNNLTAPSEEELKIAPNQKSQNETESDSASENNREETTINNSDSAQNEETTAGFGVQIGAFSNYNNALSVKETVTEMGYRVVITDSSPHQVQVVGYESRAEAESAAADLEKEGYAGFIVIRE
ncbi:MULTISPECIES: SPOR domain-containing protein [Halanaerobium]|jgi:cell division protein FtsN|uniref:Sporulation related domain-containing protein n=1 Tax=Halanaerobium kushneri TaxID=56779 RepID=A0A1N6XVQ9_9FIRM|nr:MULTISPECIES: SPOR domain-containing protein [Halanaerobium]RCW54946.1 sporulation related protein [Halanaerobium sp. ST460_2HS_T2]SIR06374.1 Sporulation related domain-containing protein [Halanaerobium kushneri]